MLTIAGSILMAGCEPVEVIELRRPDLSPVVCPDGAPTRFTVSFATRGSDEAATHSSAVDASQNAFSTDPPYPLAGILAGSVEGGRLTWIQFDVFCADGAEPFLSTPRITPSQLIKKGERLFHYIVSAPGSDATRGRP